MVGELRTPARSAFAAREGPRILPTEGASVFTFFYTESKTSQSSEACRAQTSVIVLWKPYLSYCLLFPGTRELAQEIRLLFSSPLMNSAHAMYCLLEVNRIEFKAEILATAESGCNTSASTASEGVKNHFAWERKAANQWHESRYRFLRRMQFIAAVRHIDDISDRA